MERSPSWEANRFLVSQEISRILWNPNIHYHIHKCPPRVHILSKLDSVYNPTSYFLKIYLNITLLSTPGSPNGLLLSDFPIEKVYIPLLSPIRATCLTHLILLYFITRSILVEGYSSLSSSLCGNKNLQTRHLVCCC
jgi:hypothetical protein